MGDLISRDALREEVEFHVTTVSVCATAEEARGMTRFKQTCLEDIDKAPAVDAIPEWLEKRLNETAYSDPDLNNAIFQVLVDWEKQKKRETQDG